MAPKRRGQGDLSKHDNEYKKLKNDLGAQGQPDIDDDKQIDSPHPGHEDLASGISDSQPDTVHESGHDSKTKHQNLTPIVISGISGRFPESGSMREFRDNLFNGVDMVTEDARRWPPGMHGLPGRNGKLKELDKFDATFFGIAPKQVERMDPQLRILLEVAYEAIVDAGVNPQSLRGSSTGVFVGSHCAEAHSAWSGDPDKVSGYTMTGCAGTMLANRLSYWFDFKGPSFTVDTACSSSLIALNQALTAIRTGQCEAALVAGSNLLTSPHISMEFNKLNMLSADGACKSFDESGSGYVRSEAVIAIYLQQSPGARRVYATVLHSETNCDGNKEKGITFPSGDVQQKLLESVYKNSGVDPTNIAYIEAHGTGTKAGDPQELNSIANVLCPNRRQPLLIGSTKSNMGHSEGASGLAGLAKVLVAMEENCIPANLHFKTPNSEIPALTDGRLQVVDEHMQLHGDHVSINSFGFGGSNVHAVLKANTSTLSNHPSNSHTRLFTCSARTEEGLSNILAHVTKKSNDIYMHSLLQENANSKPSLFPYRGYAVLNDDENSSALQLCPSEARPLWFVFAGMGSQWVGMARDMLHIDVFRQSLERSDAALKPHGVELMRMIREGSDEVMQNTLNSFVSITAIEVALVDVLHRVGIEPDGMVGHSVGELACAYADGGFTADEAVLAAYWRGRCIMDAKLPPGAMAAVGLTWEQARERCPQGVVPACHNSTDSVTISGPADSVTNFVKQLQTEGIFAKLVASSGVAFHSYFMQQIAPSLTSALTKIIKTKRPRTSRWISSSIPESAWNSNMAAYSSVEYHVNNLVSPVLFQEALRHIPDNAVVVELAPHGLLQAILKRTLSSGCAITSLMKRKHRNNAEFMLSNLGKLYIAGVDMYPLRLHAPVSYPVPRGTPMLAPLIQWDHSQSWSVPTAKDFVAGGSGDKGGCSYTIDTSPGSEDQYLVDHKIEGRVLYPATGYLVLTWRTLARMRNEQFDKMPVVFEDIHIHQATVLPKEGTLTLHVHIHPGTGKFEVTDSSDVAVVTGVIRYREESQILQLNDLMGMDCDRQNTLQSNDVVKMNADGLENSIDEHCAAIQTNGEIVDNEDTSGLDLTTNDVYTSLRLRGYEYGPTFQVISSTDIIGTNGFLHWDNNWVPYLDSMLQMNVFTMEGFRLPTRIKSVHIDPHRHVELASEKNGSNIPVTMDRFLNVARSGGITIIGLHASIAPRRQQAIAPVLAHTEFVPYNRAINIDGGKSYLEECNYCIMDGIQRTDEHGLLSLLGQENVHNYFLQTMSAVGKEMKRKSRKRPNLERQNTLKLLQGFEKPSTFLALLDGVFSLRNNADTKKHIATMVQSQSIAFETDKLLSAMKQGCVLKSCLHVVDENMFGQPRTMKIVEYGNGKFYQKLLPWCQSIPNVTPNYTLVSNEGNAESDKSENGQLTQIRWDMHGKIPDEVNQADLVVIDEVCFDNRIEYHLNILKQSVKPGGFLLLHGATSNHHIAIIADAILRAYQHNAMKPDTGSLMNESEVIAVIEKCGLDIVSNQSSKLLHSLYLCRKVEARDHNMGDVIDVSGLDFDWLEDVKVAIRNNSKVWLIANQANSGVVGMATCLRKEPGGHNIRCIINMSGNISASCMKAIKHLDLAVNVHQNDIWGHFSPQPIEDDKMHRTEHAFVDVLTRGDLSSLRWIESPLKYFDKSLTSDVEICDVHYTSLNFRDIMLATGKLPPDAIPGELSKEDCLLGMEFSGTNSEGRAIMGILPAKALATSVAVTKRFVWSVPKDWSLEDAASVPVVYTTAYYALVVRGQIRRGDTVLIHSGSGGVGQAAIAIALHHGCHVFTTVGTEHKKDYVKARFPQLREDHFFNSRNASFSWDILRKTRGRGCDVILNSLADDLLKASLQCLAQHGRFLEIGKYDLANNTALGMALFLRNVTFHGILLDSLFEDGNREWDLVSSLMTDGLASEVVKPLNTTVFGAEEVESAFRFMAQGKHIGKVLIKIRDEEETETQFSIPAIARCYCDPNKSYVITGGLGGFGLQLAQWLINRGARYIILTSRRGVTTGYQRRSIRSWNKIAGVSVSSLEGDVSLYDQAAKILEYAKNIAPVGGIFHLAAVLKDGLIDNQTTANFKAVCRPKIQGTVNLDELSRQTYDNHLDWFVVFSSVVSQAGNAGQTNYGFANSFMERICEKRRQDGLPGMALQWGAIGDVGIVVESMGGNDTIVAGTTPQRISSCLAQLDKLLTSSKPVVSCHVISHKTSTTAKENAEGGPSILNAIAHVLGIADPTKVNLTMTLGDLGLDSLMSVEIKQILDNFLDGKAQKMDVRSLTFAKLSELATSGSMSASDDISTNESNRKGNESPNFPNLGDIRGKSLEKRMPLDKVIHMTSKSGMEAHRPVFFMPTLVGTIVPVKEVVSHIHGDVYGLQCTEDAPQTNLVELAQYLIKSIKPIQPNGPYRIAGFSFGACVATEVAAQLSTQGQKVTLSLIDGSPQQFAAFTAHFRGNLKKEDEAQKQSKSFCAFANFEVKDVDFVKLNQALMQKPDLRSRARTCAEYIISNTALTDQVDLEEAAMAYYHRLVMIEDYAVDTEGQLLDAEVHLIKSTQGHAGLEGINDQYGLDEIFRSVKVSHVEGDHFSCITGSSARVMADYINSYV